MAVSGRAFIGSFTSAGGRGILTATVEPRTGSLTVLHTTETVPDPSFLALSADGHVLHAVSETESGAVYAFDVRGERPVPLGGPVPVEADSPTHLTVAGDLLLTANYGSGSVTALALGADGTPSGPARVMAHRGSGPDAARQQGPHAHQVLPDPTGRWLLCVDLGTDSVWIRAADTLRLHREAALRPGSGPRHLAFHPAGRHAYVVGELDPVVTVCRWNAEEGALVPLGETPLGPGTAGAAGGHYPSEPVVSRDGRFLWVAGRGRDSITVLALDEAGESAAPVTTVPCGGHWPRDLTLDPTGRRLYAANERSGTVTWFDVDPETGVPAPAGSLPAPAASCVIFG
ncbi:lactonase family protein [Streptomyces sp. GC420]|uniref:lactonase family protein n=1 Tax=Streptomyces sp. GC420 TaxID=2697568 RepID=UPI00141521EF|nr:lactonase family protein [Streptomyces sp. GC420]NBM14617.1 beta-propeller fold lactonase family protein [Streptomyces sp. GC420]